MARNRRLFFLFLALLVVFVCVNWHLQRVNQEFHNNKHEHYVDKNHARLERWRAKQASFKLKDSDEVVYDYANDLSHVSTLPSVTTTTSVTTTNELTSAAVTTSDYTSEEEETSTQTEEISTQNRTVLSTQGMKSHKMIVNSMIQYEKVEGFDVVYDMIYEQIDMLAGNDAPNSFPLLVARNEQTEKVGLSSFLVSSDKRLSRDELSVLLATVYKSKAFLIDLDLLGSVKFNDPAVDLDESLPFKGGSGLPIDEFEKLSFYHQNNDKLFLSFGVEALEVDKLNRVCDLYIFIFNSCITYN
jgi:hypothetical protein